MQENYFSIFFSAELVLCPPPLKHKSVGGLFKLPLEGGLENSGVTKLRQSPSTTCGSELTLEGKKRGYKCPKNHLLR